jgi:MoaA/NifB/PqqE/SkfB family radical SAM enzyme
MTTETNNLGNYNWKDRIPHYIKVDDLTEEQKTRLMHSSHFCMLPWVHVHAWPDGTAYPCCLAKANHPVGNFKKDSMKTVWNDEPMRRLRRNMLADLPSPECGDCYEQEASGFASMRNNSNKGFGHHIHIVDETDPDGVFSSMDFKYWDVRFSNICNLKCRSCGSIFSSRWYDDDVKLWGKPLRARIQYAGQHALDIWEQMEPHLDSIEQIYFAGGEPLIMEEHNRILKTLIKRGRADKVRLIYNTNLTELKWKRESVIGLWKHFRFVCVAASLDDMGERAAVIRSGTDWPQVEQNIRDIKKECPHIDFMISPTLSIMNIWRFIEYHRYMIEQGFIEPKDFNLNILQGPVHYRIDVLPLDIKLEFKKKFEEHIAWLQDKDPIHRAKGGFEAAINFMMAEDNSKHLPTFWEVTDKLDRVRGESLSSTVPELERIMSYKRKVIPIQNEITTQ